MLNQTSSDPASDGPRYARSAADRGRGVVDVQIVSSAAVEVVYQLVERH